MNVLEELAAQGDTTKHAARQLTPHTLQHETLAKHGHAKIDFLEAKEHDPSKPLRLRHLVKRPIVRQYIRDGMIHRENCAHESASTELWLDLVFASIAHHLAEGVVDPITGLNVARFILTFWASYSIWADLRLFINQCGTDDWLQRLYILLTVLILSGFSSNASGIELEGSGAVMPEETGSFRQLLAFTSDSNTAIRTAFALISVSFAIRAARNAVYSIMLPKFRIFFMVRAIVSTIIWGLWFPPIFAHSINAVFGFPAAALLFEWTALFAPAIPLYYSRWKGNPIDNHMAFAAYAIEHHIERQQAFITVVVGEIVISAGFDALNGNAGIHSELGRSWLTIIISFFIAILYYNEANCRSYKHALRVGFLSGTLHGLMHFPLASGIILMASVLPGYLVPGANIDNSVEWYFSGSLAVVVISIFVMGMLHQTNDDPKADLIPRKIRGAARVAVALIFALIPLQDTLDATKILGLHAGLLAFLIIVDVVGSIGSRAVRHEMMTATEEKVVEAEKAPAPEAAAEECMPEIS